MAVAVEDAKTGKFNCFYNFPSPTHSWLSACRSRSVRDQKKKRSRVVNWSWGANPPRDVAGALLKSQEPGAIVVTHK